MEDELITIGKITKHQGNKGEVKVIPLTDYPDRFELLEQAILTKDDEQKRLNIEDMRYHKEFIILKFEGIDDIGAATEVKNFLIKIPKSEAMTLPKESYYLHDIMGLQVITNTGRELGEVTDILETGSNDVYVVESDEEEYLIPALKEVIDKVDLEAGQMIITPIKGLI